MSDQPSHFEIPDHVVAKLIGDELVLLDLAGGTYFGLNAVGADMWRMLADGKSLPDVVDAISSEYDVDRSVLETDLRELLSALCDKGLVSPEPV